MKPINTISALILATLVVASPASAYTEGDVFRLDNGAIVKVGKDGEATVFGFISDPVEKTAIDAEVLKLDGIEKVRDSMIVE